MKILIVEDDANLRSGLKDLLELEGFDVVSADNIVLGFQVYQEQLPDFCILDVMLKSPNDGFELCKVIREVSSETPILMLSARVEEIDKVLGFEAGADDYLAKPFGPRELISRINAISKRTINRAESSISVKASAAFIMNGVSIDPNSLKAHKDEVAVELTKREFLILKLLYKKSGEVVSKDELFDYCWGRDFMPNSRSLDQYISSLRKKLKSLSNSISIIQTVRGAGYRFEP